MRVSTLYSDYSRSYSKIGGRRADVCAREQSYKPVGRTKVVTAAYLRHWTAGCAGDGTVRAPHMAAQLSGVLPTAAERELAGCAAARRTGTCGTRPQVKPPAQVAAPVPTQCT